MRVWQGVGRSRRRSRPGEGAGHPSRPARMAVFILYPFLSEGELQVLVNLSKVRYIYVNHFIMTSNIQVFQIAYCDFFELSKAEAWNQICADFVHSVRDFMTEMLRKQKVHYI